MLDVVPGSLVERSSRSVVLVPTVELPRPLPVQHPVPPVEPTIKISFDEYPPRPRRGKESVSLPRDEVAVCASVVAVCKPPAESMPSRQLSPMIVASNISLLLVHVPTLGRSRTLLGRSRTLLLAPFAPRGSRV